MPNKIIFHKKIFSIHKYNGFFSLIYNINMKNYSILEDFNFTENNIVRHLSNEEPFEISHYSDFEHSYKNNEDIPSDDEGIEEVSFLEQNILILIMTLKLLDMKWLKK